MDSNRDLDIVISGIDGRFPKSKNMEEFGWNLYNQIDMSTDDETRWSHADFPLVPTRKFLIDDVDKFDASLFKIHSKQAHTMDPQGRILLECAYSAILDAGVHPSTLRGSNTGVFTATCYDDTMGNVFNEPNPKDGYTLTGSQSAFLSNRVSYALDLKGPSFTMDSACSSSMYALLQAVNAIRLNQCDAALVCGANLLLNPNLSSCLAKLGVLSPDGFCRSFDCRASGYARADTISVLFIQRRKDAKRVYADIVHILGNNDGYKVSGINSPLGDMQHELFQRLYYEAGINPSIVNYVEAHATGTIVGDFEEAMAIVKTFCNDRNEPLLIGAIKPNMGHSEASSALCSIAKVIHTFETGVIPATINVEKIRKDIPCFNDGRLKMCSESTPLAESLVAVNSFGFGGANAHVLLKRWNKIKNRTPIDEVPRLVCWSGRTEESVTKVIGKLKSIPLDTEFIGLLHNIQNTQIPDNLYRGFGVFESTHFEAAPLCLGEGYIRLDDAKRSVVWVFTGLGCQWIGMGKSLMQIEPFYKSILKCHEILKRVDFDLIYTITTDDQNIFDSIVNSITGIAAIQIALIDLLRILEVPVDYIIGHSAGEMLCAYADGALTMEQAIFGAYYKGKVSAEGKTIDGMMAAVGVGYRQIKDCLPPSLYDACHNSVNSCTISGPKDDVLKFVEELKSENIFTRQVYSSHIAFHSKYIADWKTKYLEYLKNIMPEATMRSSKWISSSIPMDQLDLEYARYNTAEYHANNMISPVLFEEACSVLPKDAILIEIAPHALLQPILKKSFPSGVLVPLTQRNNPNNAAFFMAALGKLFLNGISLQIDRLYPKVEFPVSRGTPMIGPLIKFDHEQSWFVPSANSSKKTSFERQVSIDITQEQYQHLANHVIDDRCIMSGATYLHLVWETLALISSKQDVSDFNVEFTNVRYIRTTCLRSNVPVHLSILIHTNGNFELTEGRTAIVTGTIKHIPNDIPTSKILVNLFDENSLILSKKEIYKEIQLRGYKYTKEFKAMNSFCCSNSTGRVQWNGYWDAFMDAMTHSFVISKETRKLHLPTSVQKVRINAVEHMNYLQSMEQRKRKLFDVKYKKDSNTILCGGIEIIGLETKAFERRKSDETEVLESYEFVPLMDASVRYSLIDAIRICIQLTVEKSLPKQLSILEVLDDNNAPLIERFRDVVLVTPRINATYKLITNRKFKMDSIQIESPNTTDHSKYTVVIYNGNHMNIKSINEKVSQQGFLIITENVENTPKFDSIDGFSLISTVKNTNISFSILQRKAISVSGATGYKVISIHSEDYEFIWLKKVQAVQPGEKVILLAERDKNSGVLGFLNALRCETIEANYQCVVIEDDEAPAFDLENPFYKLQLYLGLPVNVLRNGKWGTFRYLDLKPPQIKLSPSIPLCVKVGQLGNLQSFEWAPTSLDCKNESVKVCFAALSQQDLVVAKGELLKDAYVEKTVKTSGSIGKEYSGINSNNRRVMGIAFSGGALATQIWPSTNDLMFNVPDSIDLREAATIPLAYLNIYSAFFIGNRIKSDQTVLIQDAYTSLGLAAIQVALAYCVDVFALVSSVDGKSFLLHHYPELNESNVIISTIPSFEQTIFNKTNGFGVDYLLITSTGDQIGEYIQCLSDGGTLFMFEPTNATEIANLTQQLLEKSVVCKAINLEKLIAKPDNRKHLIDIFYQDLNLGIIKPLPLKMFKSNEIENAFSFISNQNSVPRTLVEIPSLSAITSLKIKPKFVAASNSVYIITGGLGGLGLELANWLIMRGAKMLMLSSRKGVTTSYQQYRINFFTSLGCTIVHNTSDIKTFEGCKNLLEESLKYGPIIGIFNLAGVLLDSTLPNQTEESFKKCFAAKVYTTNYLDELSRTLCPQLEHFVGFSSIAGGRGSAGQTNYAMANFIMDRIIENRVRKNLPGKSIQWSPICDIGMVSQMTDGDDTIEIIGMKQQCVDRCFRMLDDLLFAQSAIVSSGVIPHKRAIEEANVLSRVLRVFGVKDLKKVPAGATLADLGLDSLVISEIKQILEREASVDLSPAQLKSMTIDGLKKVIGVS